MTLTDTSVSQWAAFIPAPGGMRPPVTVLTVTKGTENMNIIYKYLHVDIYKGVPL